MKPNIAVLTRLTTGGPRVNPNYLSALERAGARTSLLHPPMTATDLKEALQAADGLLIPGGTDLDPALYGQSNAEGLSQGIDPLIDTLDLEAITFAREHNLPVLGICRGLQVLNVAYGGTLYQDIETNFSTAIPHRFSQEKDRPLEGHTVTIEPGSRLHAILGDQITVNTYHHQGIRQLGEALTPTAFSPDGLIEAFEAPGILAVQWHPERMTEIPAFQSLFDDFVQTCRKKG